MKHFLKRTFDFWWLQCDLLSPRVAAQIHAADGAPRDFSRAANGVILRDTSLSVTLANAAFFGRAGAEMRALSSGVGAQWKPLDDGKFEARLAGLTFEISSAEDVFVLSEVFGLGVYSLSQPGRAIVIDIGANIGASSLFFASKPWVKQVYSFEPLKPTAQIARANFSRNSAFQGKITLFEYGLGSADETLSVEYSPEWKGKSGPKALPSDLPRTVKSWTESIQLRNVSAILPAILDAAADCAVVVKMDCEGGEWKILPELARSGLLKRIDLLLFEWHDRTPEPLEQILVENGFSAIRRTDVINAQIGLVYAANLSARSGAPA